MTSVVSIAHADVYPSIHEGQTVEANGFECADSALHVMDILGRGPEFPNFIINDVETELNRQNQGARLINITCVAEPKLMASHAADTKNSNGQAVVSALSVSFPLHLEVKNRANTKNISVLEIEQNYLVEHLDTEELPTVTQNFIVKSSD